MISIFIQRGLALIGLVFLFPLFFIVAVAISISSGIPIFFKQKRIGLYGKPFLLYKFRSMRTDNHSKQGTFDIGSNKRVTNIGFILRKTKIDELPQLINVLKGDMLLVGPRPEIQKWVDVYPDRWKRVHTVHPGITDPASIVYRNEEWILSQSKNPEKTYKEDILPHKLDLYEKYLSNKNIIEDIKILFKTFVVILH